MSSDFIPQFKDKNKFLSNQYTRSLVDNEIFSIDNMTDREIREAIIDDILGITMWEKEFSDIINFTKEEFYRFIPQAKQQRVEDQLSHDEILGIIIDTPNGLRIRNDRAILQAAMDYSGGWYEGFVMPPDAIQECREGVSKIIENLEASHLFSVKDINNTFH